MIINKPLLPPKEGYVEVIDENGEHVYQETSEAKEKREQGEKLAALETDKTALASKLNASIQSNSFLEECVIEMAMIVYA